jgi:hypothetical protein
MRTPTNSYPNLLRALLCAVLSVGLLSACYGEDFADCPPLPATTRTVTLHFDLGGEFSDDAFTDRMKAVNVGIYDAEGDSIGNRQVSTDELSDFAGVVLDLPGGDYHFICWGNIDDDDDDDGKITYEDNRTNDVPPLQGSELGDIRPDLPDAGDSDPLWLGQARGVSIPQTGDWSTRIPFSPRYWELETFLNGSAVDGMHVLVELLGLPDGANARTAALNDDTTSSYELTESRTVGAQVYEFADFRTFRFDPYDNDVRIVVETPADGHELYSARLEDIMPQGVHENDDIILPILITIDAAEDGIGVKVTVSAPAWVSDDGGWTYNDD